MGMGEAGESIASSATVRAVFSPRPIRGSGCAGSNVLELPG